MRLRRTIQLLFFSNKPFRFIILAFILITYGILGKNLFSTPPKVFGPPRGVITTLVRSNNQSILLTINMIHSVLKFHSINSNRSYPFIIFHDHNFTTSMRQHISSCILNSHKYAQILFALVDFQTSIQPSNTSPREKPIGYRLMCRFWTYDIFHHPAIVQGRYDYVMRMDDDSYFFDEIREDLFAYMQMEELDYVYRATYMESRVPMESILQRYIGDAQHDMRCIYNNFFIIRLKWYYESKRIQSFVGELLKDDLILREYIGDGCIHAAMLEIDSNAKMELMTDLPYGHNFHVMPSYQLNWKFYAKSSFYEQIQNSCDHLIVIRSTGVLRRINLLE